MIQLFLVLLIVTTFLYGIFLLRTLTNNQMNQVLKVLTKTSDSEPEAIRIRPIKEQPIVVHESNKHLKD